MSINEREHLINTQLRTVENAILIDDVIGGDGSEIYVEFKGRSSRFNVDEELGNSINKWLDNLPVITVAEVQQVIYKYSISLEKISELLEDEELMEIKNIEKWVEKYNNHDFFLPIEVIDRIVEVNL